MSSHLHTEFVALCCSGRKALTKLYYRFERRNEPDGSAVVEHCPYVTVEHLHSIPASTSYSLNQRKIPKKKRTSNRRDEKEFV